ncbi:MAG: hypothetical protein H2212_04890 [Ruminococcus sp.]|nr:hypothetical protein [Ruminococcus sp.]
MYKKSICIVSILLMSFGLTACGEASPSKDNELTAKVEEQDKPKEIDLSKDPINGEWTLYSLTAQGGQPISAGELIATGELHDSLIYKFNKGLIEATEDPLGISEWTWTKEEDNYKIVDIDEVKITLSDERMEIIAADTTIILAKGVKSSEELLKEANLWHEDELLITGHNVTNKGNGFFTIDYTIKNNTDKDLTFKGIHMRELNAQNTILKEYESYNKNAQDTQLAPGQDMILILTFAESDGIAVIENASYEFTIDESSPGTIGKFSVPYIIQL